MSIRISQYKVNGGLLSDCGPKMGVIEVVKLEGLENV